MSVGDYRLSCELSGHSLDVRGVAVSPDGFILSASRDATARLWHPTGVRDFSNVITFKGHTNFVSSVCYLKPCRNFPEGLVVTGSNDKTVCGYSIQDPSPVLVLKGHENTVCCVSPGQLPGTILSASWDSTGRVWSADEPDKPPLVLSGHEAVVWGIIELGNGSIATASADKSIILWSREGKKIKSLSGHTDCVRALAVADEVTFLSCANDASIRLWTNAGECINTFYGHSNYIYSVIANPYVEGNCFVSCGEDSTVRVWSAGDNVCTITLPAMSAWGVACLTNGDIVVGSSDGIVRVFTKDPKRQADEDVLKTFEDSVKVQLEASTQEIGGFKVTELPGPEALFQPGKTDGQTKLIRSGEKVKCYSWSAATQTWNELGEVTGSAKPTEGKQLYQGKEYDFVFNVDIEDGKPAIKLPYNMTEDPWHAAQTFIHKNHLPQVYLEQVANFIITNSKRDSVPMVTDSSFVDPFTGEGRYVPGTNQNSNVVTGNADPFTGSSSYTTTANPIIQSAPPTTNYFPHKSYLRFDKGNCSAILEKLLEFNLNLDHKYKISENDIHLVVRLADQNANYDRDAVRKLKSMLEWPKECLFPVLDIVRLAIRNEEISADLFNRADYGPRLIDILINNLTPGTQLPNQLLALRTITNAFIHLQGEMMVLKEFENIINRLIPFEHMNKNMQIASSTVMLNLSVALGQQNDSKLLCMCLLDMSNNYIDNEAQFRGLVALGTLIVEAPVKSNIKNEILANASFMNRLRSYANCTSDKDVSEQKLIKISKQILQNLI